MNLNYFTQDEIEAMTEWLLTTKPPYITILQGKFPSGITVSSDSGQKMWVTFLTDIEDNIARVATSFYDPKELRTNCYAEFDTIEEALKEICACFSLSGTDWKF